MAQASSGAAGPGAMTRKTPVGSLIRAGQRLATSNARSGTVRDLWEAEHIV